MLSGPAGLQAQLFRWRKLFWLAVAIVTFLFGDAAMGMFGPPAFATALLRALIAGEAPTIATAASFSVSAGSFSTRTRAAAFAAALHASGLPILVRQRPEDGRYQVLVGPYVSTDEAEHAQRKLAAWGLGDPRLVVDDTMRSRPQRAAIVGVGSADDGVVMVAAAGMSSVVFEMRSTPRAVEARRTSATTLDIDIGEGASEAGDSLTLPEGVVLVHEVTVASARTGEALHAHLVVPEGVQSRLRLEGQRVYVDLAWPQPPWMPGPKGPGLPGKGSGKDTHILADPPTGADAYRDQLRVAVGRFQEIQPFLLSALESPDPDVLAALEHSLEGVRDSVKSMSAPSELENSRQLLLASVTLASGAVTPSFNGDRASTLHQAIAMFEDATK